MRAILFLLIIFLTSPAHAETYRKASAKELEINKTVSKKVSLTSLKNQKARIEQEITELLVTKDIVQDRIDEAVKLGIVE